MSESTTAGPRPAEPGAAAQDSTIRPFQVSVPDEDLVELRRRIDATRWPDRETVDDDSQGVPLVTMQELARYWAADYDWRRVEARLNALPQFTTEIDGLDIHFIHVRSQHENALPVIVTHGWPGSILEQLKIIGPLTDPTSHGASEADAFHVVIPSLPGHGFSAKPTATGWDPVRIARAWVVLMHRLGYTRFVAQGGDWGAAVTQAMGVQAAPGLLGIHSNMPGTAPQRSSGALRPATRRRPVSQTRNEPPTSSCGPSTPRRGLCADHGDASPDAVRVGRLAGRSRGLHARPRRRDRSARPGHPGPGGDAPERPHPRRPPRQHHAVLADQHLGLGGSPLLGEQGGLLRCQGHHHTVRHQRVPRRAVPTTWEGVSLDTLLDGVETSAGYALVISYGGYTTNLPLEDLTDHKAWIAFKFDGQDLEPEHGGPARLLVPQLYLWKSAKWIRGIQLGTPTSRASGRAWATTTTATLAGAAVLGRLRRGGGGGHDRLEPLERRHRPCRPRR